MVGSTGWKIHISSWEEFLDHKVCKQGNKLLRDSKIKSSNKILNNYSYGVVYVDFNVKAGNWN